MITIEGERGEVLRNQTMTDTERIEQLHKSKETIISIWGDYGFDVFQEDERNPTPGSIRILHPQKGKFNDHVAETRDERVVRSHV